MFISFEGVDGSGKSTQIRLFAAYLEEKNIPYIMLREPGSTKIGEKIRDLLLDPENSEMQPETEAVLYAAARVQLIKEVIKPALSEGKVVICDRYLDSSIAYQAYGRELGLGEVLRINDYAVKNCLPDITIFLDVPPKTAGNRMEGRTLDRLELEGITFKERVYKGFHEAAKHFPERIRVITATGTKEETQAMIRHAIREKGL
ncbi:MAG: dTMP kinase [Clostridiales bacterium]|nr:dTMP kinase [Clostridiales bacterium]